MTKSSSASSRASAPETLRLTTPWQDHLDVPLARIVGVHIGLLDRKESAESFAKRLKTRVLGRLAAGPDEKRRGHRDSRHSGRRRRRQAAVSVPGPNADDAAQASGGLDHGGPPQSSPRSDELRPTFTLPGAAQPPKNRACVFRSHTAQASAKASFDTRFHNLFSGVLRISMAIEMVQLEIARCIRSAFGSSSQYGGSSQRVSIVMGS